VIRPAGVSSRVVFASRRSAVRSRLAPFEKCLVIGPFSLVAAAGYAPGTKQGLRVRRKITRQVSRWPCRTLWV